VFVQSGRGSGVRVCLAWLALSLGFNYLFIICLARGNLGQSRQRGTGEKGGYHLRVDYSHAVPERTTHQRCVIASGTVFEAVHSFIIVRGAVGLC
jgi:hypothetical protein